MSASYLYPASRLVLRKHLPRNFSALALHTNHRGIGNLGMADQKGLKLSRRYLHPIILDEFL